MIRAELQNRKMRPTLSKKAVGVIRERAPKPDNPFLLYLALSAPHTPWVPRASCPPSRDDCGRPTGGIYLPKRTQEEVYAALSSCYGGRVSYP